MNTHELANANLAKARMGHSHGQGVRRLGILHRLQVISTSLSFHIISRFFRKGPSPPYLYHKPSGKKKVPSVVRPHQYCNPVYRRVFFCHSTVYRIVALFGPSLATKHPCAESIRDRNVLFIPSEYLPSPTIRSPENSPARYHEPSAYPRDSCNIQKRNRAPVRTLSMR